MGLEVRGIFLDISIAFDKVWHDGLIFKLRENGIYGEMINILEDFLSNKKRKVILNCQCLSWVDICAGAPQGVILGPLLRLIYINDLPNDIKNKWKLFASDTSLFSVVHGTYASANDLNHDLEEVSEWAFQWKMNFNPDLNKQAQEIIFSKEKTVSINPVVYFNNTPVNATATHKHLGMIIDSKLSYEGYLQSAFSKVNKAIGLLRKLQLTPSRKSLVTIYKPFILIKIIVTVSGRASNELCYQSLESLQYSAAVAITGEITGSSSEKLF